MNRKAVSGIMVTLFLMIMLMLTFNVQTVKADWTWTETVYIRADGSIEPDAAPISTVDNVTYTLTDNIVVDIFEDLIAIVVERNNIVVDGAGYTLQGSHWGSGINLSGRKNVTIKNIEIRQFIFGIYLSNSSDISIYNNNITHSEAIGLIVQLSSDNDVTTNNIKYNYIGIRLDEADNNCISGNQIVANGPGGGMFLLSSTNNSMFRNNVTKNWIGIGLGPSSKNNVINENVISANLGYDISISSSNNTIFHNDLNNRSQIFLSGSFNNLWDDGYPSGGNYWSNYEEEYPDAEELDGSGIWDTPYVVDENNQDNYPLMEPWTPTPPIPTTISELKTEIEELGLQNEIDNQGIVTSLIAKLNVAQKLIDNGKTDQAKNLLNALINEVQAQSGNHITVDATDILIESAEYILSHL